MDVRRGPWTEEEDMLLASYVSAHGEGRWNDLARAAGLKRTGKSCRLRWLNYLRPDVRRGNFTAEEQLLILQLHSRFGNRWSKIAELLPGRTDNEIKNYWRTRMQKHARALRCDPNSRQFLELINDLWVPHLLQKIHHAAAATAPAAEPPAAEGSSVVVPDVGNSPGSTSLSATPQSSPLPDVPDGSNGRSWSFLDDAGSAAEVGASLTCDDQGWPELDQIVWEGGDDFGDCWDMSFEQDLWCTIGN